ncbi:MAG: hypothetical protein GHCLOJNM_04170 [bacterium]|nr:hypothetical protein [bacterium]
MEVHPRVAFLVAAFNAAKTLPRCLEGIRAQNPSQIVVVDDGSTDQTPSLRDQHPDVDWVRLETNQGVGAARNAALEQVRDVDLIAFVDSDIVLGEAWLENLLKKCDWDTYSVACGRVRAAEAGTHWAATLDEQVSARTFGPKSREIGVPWREVMYFNHVFKREVFQFLGGFDPAFRTNAEDSDFFYRCAGHDLKFFYVASAEAIHIYPPPTFETYLRRLRRNGFYTIRFHLKHATPLMGLKICKALGLVGAMPLIFLVSLFSLSLRPILLLLLAFFLAGLHQSARLGFHPWFGGWIWLSGWVARGFGEVEGLRKWMRLTSRR